MVNVEAVPEFYVCAVGALYATVCTSLAADEAALRLNAAAPTGLPCPWKLVADPSQHLAERTGTCPDAPNTNRHLLFEIRADERRKVTERLGGVLDSLATANQHEFDHPEMADEDFGGDTEELDVTRSNEAGYYNGYSDALNDVRREIGLMSERRGDGATVETVVGYVVVYRADNSPTLDLGWSSWSGEIHRSAEDADDEMTRLLRSKPDATARVGEVHVEDPSGGRWT